MNSTALPPNRRTAAGWQWLFPLARVLVIGIALVDCSSVIAQDLQCPDGQVVMEYAGMAPEMYTGYSDVFLSVTTAAYDEDNFTYTQAWSDTPTFEPFCVPEDKCLTVNIRFYGFNTGTEPPPVSIIYDSMTLTLLGPFFRDIMDQRFDFYGQAGGSCEVACDEDQVLLEIEALEGGFDHDWQVIDDSTNEIVRACLPPATPVDTNATWYYNNFCYWSSDSWVRDRVCVPKDGCYRFVVGDNTMDTNLVTVTLGGEIVLQAKDYRFESLLLLHSESPDTCSGTISDCQSTLDPSREAMEIFIFRGMVVYDDIPILTWNAKMVDPNGSTYEVENILVAGDRPLQYNQLCIPGCASFYVNNTDDAFSYEVRVDGTIYVQSLLGMDLVRIGDIYEDDSKSSLHTVGSLCRSHVCEGPGQSLVEVGVRYAPPLTNSFPLSGSGYAWEVVDIPKFRSDQPTTSNSLGMSVGFPSRQSGKLHRDQFCLSDWYVAKESKNEDCTALQVYLGGESMIESYFVSVNGEYFSDRIECSTEVPMRFRAMCKSVNAWYRPNSYFVLQITPLNRNCKMKGIPGYIAGGTVMGVLLLAGLCYCLIKRRRLAASRESAIAVGTHVGGMSIHGSNPTMIATGEAVATPLPNHKRPTNPFLSGYALENGTTPPTSVENESDQVPSGNGHHVHAVAASDQEDFA